MGKKSFSRSIDLSENSWTRFGRNVRPMCVVTWHTLGRDTWCVDIDCQIPIWEPLGCPRADSFRICETVNTSDCLRTRVLSEGSIGHDGSCRPTSMPDIRLTIPSQNLVLLPCLLASIPPNETALKFPIRMYMRYGSPGLTVRCDRGITSWWTLIIIDFSHNDRFSLLSLRFSASIQNLFLLEDKIWNTQFEGHRLNCSWRHSKDFIASYRRSTTSWGHRTFPNHRRTR